MDCAIQYIAEQQQSERSGGTDDAPSTCFLHQFAAACVGWATAGRRLFLLEGTAGGEQHAIE